MQKEIKIAEYLVDLLENRFRILNFRFGLDPLLGLVPGLGDAVSFVLATYILYAGVKAGLPHKKIYRMFLNIVIDLIVGLLPVVGDLGDFVYKANTKNLEILKSNIDGTLFRG